MSQADALLAILLRGETVTPAIAFQVVGSLACHSRMAELRERGYPVECTIKTDGKRRWGEYRLVLPAQKDLFTAADLGLGLHPQKAESPHEAGSLAGALTP